MQIEMMNFKKSKMIDNNKLIIHKEIFSNQKLKQFFFCERDGSYATP